MKLTSLLVAATVLFGVGYITTPLMVDAAAWGRAQGPFQTVFASMVTLTAIAVGFTVASRRPKEQ